MVNKSETFTRYDSADYLETEENIATYLNACAEENDPVLLPAALGDIARARNMTQLAAQTGLTRMGLHKALFGQCCFPHETKRHRAHEGQCTFGNTESSNGFLQLTITCKPITDNSSLCSRLNQSRFFGHDSDKLRFAHASYEARHGRARSYAAEAANTLPSSQRLPMICIPTGSP